VPCHCQSTTGEESPIEGDADHCPPPYRDGWELATLWAVVSSAMELALGRSPDKTFQVEVVDELVAEFQKLEEGH
jgi:hypothetical protein